MLTIKKTYTWEMGHALFKVGKEDKCYSPHGHNYRLIVEVARKNEEANPDTDMVVNFHELDRHIVPLVEEMDHKFYFNESDDRFRGGFGYVAFPYDPTAEALCSDFIKRIHQKKMEWHSKDNLTLTLPPGVKLISLELYETDKASAKIYCP